MKKSIKGIETEVKNHSKLLTRITVILGVSGVISTPLANQVADSVLAGGEGQSPATVPMRHCVINHSSPQ